MTEPATGLLPLLAWLSPSFPVGAFAYSQGIETAVETGEVSTAGRLEAWLVDLLTQGSLRQDAILAAEAHRLAQRADGAALRDANDLALALAPSSERRLETGQTGRAFAEAIRAAWAEAACPLLPEDGDIAYPIAFGSACGQSGVPLAPALAGLALAGVANLISAAVRLGVVGQTDGQRVLARLRPEAERLGEEAATTSLDDLGACALRSDIASLQHETLYSRLFRS